MAGRAARRERAEGNEMSVHDKYMKKTVKMTGTGVVELGGPAIEIKQETGGTCPN